MQAATSRSCPLHTFFSLLHLSWQCNKLVEFMLGDLLTKRTRHDIHLLRVCTMFRNSIKCIFTFVKNEAKGKRLSKKKKKKKQLEDRANMDENICQHKRLYIDVKSDFSYPWTKKIINERKNGTDAHFTMQFATSLTVTINHSHANSRFRWKLFSVCRRQSCLFFTWINHWKCIERTAKRIWFFPYAVLLLFSQLLNARSHYAEWTRHCLLFWIVMSHRRTRQKTQQPSRWVLAIWHIMFYKHVHRTYLHNDNDHCS